MCVGWCRSFHVVAYTFGLFADKTIYLFSVVRVGYAWTKRSLEILLHLLFFPSLIFSPPQETVEISWDKKDCTMLRFILISNCVIINNNGYCWLKPSSSHNTSISSFNFFSFQYLNAKSSKFGNPGSSSRKLVKDRDDDDDDIWPQPGIWILNCHAEIRTGERLDWLVSAIDIWKCICTLGLRVVREFLHELMYILYSKQRKSRKKIERWEEEKNFFLFLFLCIRSGVSPYEDMIPYLWK